MGKKLTGKNRKWGLALTAVMLSYFIIWGFPGSGPLSMLALALIPTILLLFSKDTDNQKGP